jgi:hypothetical protein
VRERPIEHKGDDGVGLFYQAANCGHGYRDPNGDWGSSVDCTFSLDRARDSIDLVAASVDASLGILEHAISGEDFVNRRAPTRRVVLTEDVVKIAGQQGRYAVGHGCCFSSLDRVPLALMYQAA